MPAAPLERDCSHAERRFVQPVAPVALVEAEAPMVVGQAIGALLADRAVQGDVLDAERVPYLLAVREAVRRGITA